MSSVKSTYQDCLEKPSRSRWPLDSIADIVRKLFHGIQGQTIPVRQARPRTEATTRKDSEEGAR